MVAKESALDPQKATSLVRDYLQDQADVMAAYLYGSLVAGKIRSRSDVDIALLFSRDLDKVRRFDRQMEISADLETRLLRDIDIVDLQIAPPTLQHQVLKTSELLLDRMPAERKAFEVRSRRVFMELQPHYARRTEALLAQFQGGDRDG